MARSLLCWEAMLYQAFSRCRALGISARDFDDPRTLALALERRVEPGNVRRIVGLLRQMTSDSFVLAEARRAFDAPSVEGPGWRIDPWYAGGPIAADLDERFLYCDERSAPRLRAWLASIPRPLLKEIRAFFDAPPHRFVLAADPSARDAVQLGVRDAAMELSYWLPDSIDGGSALLAHLRIGTLYHELLAAARTDPGLDAGRILALLAGEPRARESSTLQLGG